MRAGTSPGHGTENSSDFRNSSWDAGASTRLIASVGVVAAPPRFMSAESHGPAQSSPGSAASPISHVKRRAHDRSDLATSRGYIFKTTFA